MSPRDAKQYLAWTNSRRLALRELGLKPVAAKPKTLADHLAAVSTRVSA